MGKLRAGDSSMRDAIQEYNAAIENATIVEKERNENEQEIIEEKKELLEDEKDAKKSGGEEKDKSKSSDSAASDAARHLGNVAESLPNNLGGAAQSTLSYQTTATEKQIGIERSENELVAKAVEGIPFVGAGASGGVRLIQKLDEVAQLMKKNVEGKTRDTLIGQYKGAVEAGIISVDEAAGLARQNVDAIRDSKRRGEKWVEKAAQLAGGELDSAAEKTLQWLQRQANVAKDYTPGKVLGLYKETQKED